MTHEFRLKTNQITEDYTIDSDVLGTGITGKVVGCTSKRDGRRYALKVLELETKNHRARREVELHWRVSRCRNIVPVYDVYDNVFAKHRCLLVVMERMDGGELFDRIQKKSANGFTEREVAHIIYDICVAIKYLHDRNIAHRDLKPENLLYTTNGHLKLTDFGFAKVADDTESLKTPVFTPYYAAPEILGNGTYNKSCDMWSLGVIMYILLCGYPPFSSQSNVPMSPGMKSRITKGQYEFPSEEWSRVSPRAKDIVRGLLWKKPTERLTIDQLMSTAWIKEHTQVPGTPLESLRVLREESKVWSNVQGDLTKQLEALRIDSGQNDNAISLGSSPSSALAKKRKASLEEKEMKETGVSGSQVVARRLIGGRH